MTAGTWTFPNGARTNLLNGTFDIDSDTWRVALVTWSSNIGSSTTTWAGVTNEVAQANGYTTGGVAVTLTLSGTTSVTASFSTNPTWTASGGSITARWAVLYELGGNVLCYVLLDNTPADVTTTNGNSLTIDSDGAPAPVFTLS
ncbi:hypothetical protein [Mycobacteroides abscessus]|uniref:hypothetical protein n=1 Tax=Mycobacteroides abscessus TaxID=36809 RepID=UPI00092715FF|nr:hypothetical protein [Mycobacteroides abscessus]MBN7372719.1 hypothetical protein [Mycobacteroides abscessus subsp. abscessus]MBN7520467.1 hypothetical protein [Mycobacteroides abscessus subsp. abscessus]MDB2185978.1 hypothetical protein [Mycobacteroides abscessus subsp. abscessus]MDO3172278.1 hypothetical protein [Mycobacteroides abscessus subsp. abscessus]MDO3221418.1 hypothetical protein [Mycobacteroides abscessus subsp. abscessus]